MPTNDTVREWTEDVKLTLQAGTGYSLSTNPAARTATGEIVDGDPVTLTLGNDIIRVNNDNDNDNALQDKAEAGPVAGENDLVRLGLAFPAAKPGASVTLSAGTDRVSVWDSAAKGTVVLSAGTASSRTWTFGQTAAPPTELWVEGLSGSAAEDDVAFTLSASDAGATPAPRNATSTTDTKMATGVGVAIMAGGQDVTGLKRDWLVGQMVDAYVSISAPPDWKQAPTYSWDVPGNVLRDYVIGSTQAFTIPLADQHGGNEHEFLNGRKQSSILFFWVSTAASPEAQPLSVTVGNINGQSYSAASTFNVYEPVVETNQPQHGQAGVYTINGNPALVAGSLQQQGVIARVAINQPPMFPLDLPGSWTFLQEMTTQVQYDRWLDGGTIERFGNANDGTESLDWAGFVADVRRPIHDPNNANQPVPSLVPTNTGPREFFDRPGDYNLGRTINALGKDASGQYTVPINGIDAREVTLQFDFKLYVMYRPPGGDSRWVPLQVMDWSWEGGAVDQNGGDNWQTVAARTRHPGSGPWLDAAAEPEWGQVWQSGPILKK